MTRVLIADDEAPARRRLRRLLEAHEEMEVCGEAASGTEALRLARELKPDLLLLDIEMPGASGMEVAASLPPQSPRVVFVTAWDHHAVEAFRLHALDYLLKPVEPERLAEALSRLKTGGAARLPAVERVLVETGGRMKAVGCGEIACFTSEEGNTRLWSRRGEGEFDYYMDVTLNELERRLGASGFVRVSRGALLNVAAVGWVKAVEGGGGEARLKDGRVFPVSRRRWGGVVRALEGVG